MADLGSYLIVQSDAFGAVDLDMQHSAIHSSTMYTSTIVDDTPAAVEVLIPEARHHQRRRYRRSAVIASLTTLLVGALIALLITTTSSGSGTSRDTQPLSVVGASHTTVLIRPVLCYAPPYSATTPRQAGPLGGPPCAAPYELAASALDVTPMSAQQGYTSNTIAPDPSLAAYPSSIRDVPSRVVLLPGLGGPNDRYLRAAGSAPGYVSAGRYLLGPSEMRLSTANVGSVVAQQNRAGAWIVTIHLSPAGATTWDRVAEENFHQLLAIDMGGKVVSAPIIEPTQSSFTSFNGQMEVSGAFNASIARGVAAAVKG
jgi:hypothetical protein